MSTAHQINPGQWIAKYKVIRPLNPYEYDTRAEPGSFFGMDNDRFVLFEAFAMQHTYATDLVGIYHADDLGEAVWQIETTKGWSTITAEEYKVYIGSNVSLRQFLTLKPHPMKEETTPTAGLQVEKWQWMQDTIDPDVSYWTDAIEAEYTLHKTFYNYSEFMRSNSIYTRIKPAGIIKLKS